jgi:hypothetical protein
MTLHSLWLEAAVVVAWAAAVERSLRCQALRAEGRATSCALVCVDVVGARVSRGRLASVSRASVFIIRVCVDAHTLQTTSACNSARARVVLRPPSLLML